MFSDEDAIEFSDPDHSEKKEWFLLFDLSFRLRVLVVCHCYLESQGVIRFISAPRATRKERLQHTRVKS